MSTTPLVTECSTYTSKLAQNTKKVETITNLLKGAYYQCRCKPGSLFSLSALLKDTMCAELLTEFKKVAIKRNLLIPNGKQVTYRVSHKDFIAPPNPKRTASLINEASINIKKLREQKVLEKTSKEQLFNELGKKI